MLSRRSRKTISTTLVFIWFGVLILYLCNINVLQFHRQGKDVQRSGSDHHPQGHHNMGLELKNVVAKVPRHLQEISDKLSPNKGQKKPASRSSINVLKQNPNAQGEVPLSVGLPPLSAAQDNEKPKVKKIKLKEALWETPETTFALRKRHISDICNSDPEAHVGGVKGVFKHEASGVIYCFVPKAGCTFWKRVFKVANEENPKEHSVFNISRQSIHSELRNGARFDENMHSSHHFPTRFTVARDPFSRLLSSYLDKAYLPDFWSSEMLPIVRYRKPDNASVTPDFLRMHFDQIAAIFDNTSETYSTSEDTSCGKYVTFAEFVRKSYGRQEPHWMPLSQICNPCKFNVTHLSYMETFTQDARALLGVLGLGGVLDHLDKDTQVNDELRTIVDYNFRKFENSRHVRKCTSPHELAYRLWKNFQWRGYIDPDVEYELPPHQRLPEVKEDLEQQLISARRKGIKDRARLKAAKEDFRKKLFSTLSPDMFRKLLHKYSMDFKFYGYESSKTELSALINK